MSYSDVNETKASSIYTLTDFQVKNLEIATSGRVNSFAVVEPAPADDEEIRQKLERYQKDIDDLVALGLAQDISGEFSEQIAIKREEEKRGFKVYTVTEIGFLMFHRSNQRIVN